MPDLRGDKVNQLWMVPITLKERKYAEEHGSEKMLNMAKDENYWIFNGKQRFIKESLFGL